LDDQNIILAQGKWLILYNTADGKEILRIKHKNSINEIGILSKSQILVFSKKGSVIQYEVMP